MKKTMIVLIIAAACVAGGVAGALMTALMQQAQPVQAQAKPEIKIALLNLEKASRQCKKFSECRIAYDNSKDEINKKGKDIKAAYDRLVDQLREAQATNKPEEAAILEVDIKAKEQEIKIAEEYYKTYLGELRDKFLADVLKVVYDEAVKYCAQRGYHMLLQEYTLEQAKAEEALFSSRAWADTLMNKPILYVDNIDPKAAKPNPFVKDITDDIIKVLSGG